MNNYSRFLTTLFIAYFALVQAQTTLILQPDGADGKDAVVDSRVPNHSTPTHPDFMAYDWTVQGVPTTGRSLVDFDLSSIPDSATILSAKLSLYGTVSPNGNGTHSSLSGDNTCLIQMVTSPWDEQTVNWNNQPTTSTLHQVMLNGPVDQPQDFLDLDVTNIVRLMYQDPSTYQGFMLKLVTEDYYRRMVFGSSDFDDPTKRPKLEIVYEVNGTGGSGGSGGGNGGVIIGGGGPDWPGSGTDSPTPSGTSTSGGSSDTFSPAKVAMPNVFTPNGDGSNDSFHAIFFENIASAELILINRWGEVVFSTTDLSQKWNGELNGREANEGTYFFKLVYTDMKGESLIQNGSFQLVR